ncbi:uncharacterized protein JCM15063_003551 [Sporobolomyces koalae]|uniref:uncharacterized protein n=1 Tax=Sporobolomyces koalae TaxID=500713 RepID=UPI00316E05D5
MPPRSRRQAALDAKASQATAAPAPTGLEHHIPQDIKPARLTPKARSTSKQTPTVDRAEASRRALASSWGLAANTTAPTSSPSLTATRDIKPILPSSSASMPSSASKKRPIVDSDSDSDLEILPFMEFSTPVASTSSSTRSTERSATRTSKTPSTSQPDKKPRLSEPRRSGAAKPAEPDPLETIQVSIETLISSYRRRIVTRPEYLESKIELRDEVKALGYSFDGTFGHLFEQVEAEMSGTTSKGKGKGKGKGKASAWNFGDDDEDTKPDKRMIDNRMTSAQVRAQRDGASVKAIMEGKDKPFAPKPNAEILLKKKKEWDRAKIVPLTIASAGRALGGDGSGQHALQVNDAAMERAKKRVAFRAAKKRREMRQKGIKAGIDGWIEGATAGPSREPEDMPGGLPGGLPYGHQHGNSSDSHTDNDTDGDYGPTDDDRMTMARMLGLAPGTLPGRGSSTPALSEAQRELAAFHRRNQNAQMRSPKAVDDAIEALGMKDRKSLIPGMKTNLLDFQWIGLAFMAKREMDRKVPGGVLADEMGLGKTVQTIALLMARRSHDPEIKTTLIIVPLSLLSQWEDEIEKFTIGQAVHIYHGSNKYKSKSKDELAKFDVVLTTHSTLALEWPKKRTKKKDDPDSSGEEEEKEPGLLFQLCWYRVVVDEAHIARNPAARNSKALAKLDAVFRWALTGTPMINSLRDYYPLHRFLRNKPWREQGYYQKAITSMEKKEPIEAGRLADQAIGPLILRRRKTDQLGGKALVTLPPKSENVVTLVFEKTEREIYNSIEEGYQAKVCRFFRQGTLFKNFHFILVLILRLKQLAVHPHLLAAKVGEYDRKEELRKAIRMLGEDKVRRLQQQRFELAVKRARVDDLEEAGYDDEGTCPICRDPIVGAAGEGGVLPCTHIVCMSCMQELLKNPAEDDEVARGAGTRKCKAGEAPCPMCRAPFSLEDHVDLECLEPDGDELEAAIEEAEEQADKDFIEDDEETQADRDFIVDDDVEEEEDEEEEEEEVDIKPRFTADRKGKAKATEPIMVELSDDDDLLDPSMFFDIKPKVKPEPDVKPNLASTSRTIAKMEPLDVKPRIGSSATRDVKPIRDIKPIRAVKLDPSTPVSLQKIKEDEKVKKERPELEMSPLEPSTKMMYILKKLKQYEAEDAEKLDAIEKGRYKLADDEPPPITRTIILSQFVAALELLDRYLTENNIMSVRFTGSTSADERRDAIRLLAKDDSGVKVMLLSTKAGGVGLNLTSACRVLSLDLAWSKAVEAQAFDRTYRLGQRRAVEIERVIVQDTIEERILNLQARKTLLSDMSLAEGQGDPDYVGNITVPDILSLFRLNEQGNREGDQGGAPRGAAPGRGRGRGARGWRGFGGRGMLE